MVPKRAPCQDREAQRIGDGVARGTDRGRNRPRHASGRDRLDGHDVVERHGTERDGSEQEGEKKIARRDRRDRRMNLRQRQGSDHAFQRDEGRQRDRQADDGRNVLPPGLRFRLRWLGFDVGGHASFQIEDLSRENMCSEAAIYADERAKQGVSIGLREFNLQQGQRHVLRQGEAASATRLQLLVVKGDLDGALVCGDGNNWQRDQ